MSWKKEGNLVSIEAGAVRNAISNNRKKIIDIVGETYSSFYRSESINPDTYSLRFSEKSTCRINALPAFVGGERNLAGIKWVGSFPQNVERNLQRASAMIVLNSYETGYPLAVLEGSQISSARTAASAALGARLLRPQKSSSYFRLYGAGVLNRDVVDFLIDDGWQLDYLDIADTNRKSAEALARYCRERGLTAGVHEEENGISPDLVSFATSALSPWYDEPIGSDQVLLHISLRDIVPDRLLNVRNIVDDVDHALKANTSLHLLEITHGRTFSVENYQNVLKSDGVAGSAGGVISAFGMGILDIALADFVMEYASQKGSLLALNGVLPEFNRW